MGKVRRGWQLMGQSLSVLRQDPELSALPVAGLLGAVVVDAVLWAVVFRRMPEARDFERDRMLLLFPLLVVGSVPPTFANAALVAAAGQRLRGEDPSIGSGLRGAWARFPQIVGWTLLSGLVAFVLQVIAERLHLAGRIAQLTIGLSWALATFFVIPVLVFEPVGVTDAVRRSAALFKERWGEEATMMGGLGAVTFVLLVPVLVAGSVLVAVAPVAGFAVIVGGVLVVTTGTSALSGVYTTALYRYAVDGSAPGPFTVASLEASFGQKRPHWWNREATKARRSG